MTIVQLRSYSRCD